MKYLLLSIALLASLLFMNSAGASAVTAIPIPLQLMNVGDAGGRTCVGVAFNADGSIRAACRTKQSAPCSGRGCQPVTITTTYVVTYNLASSDETVAACSATRHHPPQQDATTYVQGYDASTCPLVEFNPTGTTVMMNGSPWFYVTTNATTGAILINSNTAGYVYTP